MAFAVDEAGYAPRTRSSAARTVEPANVTLAVENMNCGGCMRKVEKALDGAPGIRTVRANLSAKRVSVGYDANLTDTEAIIARLDGAGFRAADLAFDDVKAASSADHDLLRRLAVAGFAAANIMLLSVSVWAGIASDMDSEVKQLFHWLAAVIAIPTVAYAGQPFFRSALTAIKARHLNMDVPISLALILATVMSLAQTIQGTHQVYFDAAVSLTFFLLIGRYLDQSLRSRAKGAAQNLLGMKAGWATVRHEDGTTERLPARALVPGMRILVAAGDRISADGKIVDGRTEIDEQLITGETVPRTAGAGDTVYAGTVALNAPIEIEATAADDDTLIAEIARLMETAEQNKGRYVRLADRAAALYAPVVHTLGLLTFLGWMALGAGWEQALMTAISVLIITCPCALALAVPAVQVAATSRLFRNGVIMTKADGLERLAEIDTIVFDKTGTLTRGQPELTNGDQIDDGTLAAAAALAIKSRHPYAEAVVREANARGVSFSSDLEVSETPGAGLAAVAGAAGEARLGSADWCGAADEADAASLYYRSGDGRPPIALRFVDAPREDAAHVVAQARAAGLKTVLLSGDRPAAVAAAAEATGIDTWFAGQKPDEKIARLEERKKAGERVLMVGDGLNDAPALAAAHASLSPATGAEVSQIAADGIIQGARLGPIVDTLAVARHTRAMSMQNFAIAAAYNAICIPLAMAGFVTPLVAAIAMSASSILVTGNAMRLTTIRLKL